MKFIISGKNIDVTPGLKDTITHKLGKLERYFTPDTEIIVTLSVEKERQKIEVTIPVKGQIIRSEQVSSDMYVSIDLVEEVIERQLRKYKTKLIARHQEGGNFKQEFFDSQEQNEADEEIRIVRTKRFGIKPMYPEDACIEMELLGHEFFVFCNAETEEVNVVYKRKNGTFGLIEPEFTPELWSFHLFLHKSRDPFLLCSPVLPLLLLLLPLSYPAALPVPAPPTLPGPYIPYPGLLYCAPQIYTVFFQVPYNPFQGSV